MREVLNAPVTSNEGANNGPTQQSTPWSDQHKE